MVDERLRSFLQTLSDIEWLSHTGEPLGDARVVASIQAGFDGENRGMLAVWLPRSKETESFARSRFGDGIIDRIFDTISEAIHEPLYRGLCEHFERNYPDRTDDITLLQQSVDSGLYPEIMDTIKRNVCWAGIEWVLERPAFYSALLDWYRRGRLPCSWDGEYPEGQQVVL
jgi:hypothetical protein